MVWCQACVFKPACKTAVPTEHRPAQYQGFDAFTSMRAAEILEPATTTPFSYLTLDAQLRLAKFPKAIVLPLRQHILKACVPNSFTPTGAPALYHFPLFEYGTKPLHQVYHPQRWNGKVVVIWEPFYWEIEPAVMSDWRDFELVVSPHHQFRLIPSSLKDLFVERDPEIVEDHESVITHFGRQAWNDWRHQSIPLRWDTMINRINPTCLVKGKRPIPVTISNLERSLMDWDAQDTLMVKGVLDKVPFSVPRGNVLLWR